MALVDDMAMFAVGLRPPAPQGGRYTRSALYPLARYINQALAVWMKRKYKRFHRRLGRARRTHPTSAVLSDAGNSGKRVTLSLALRSSGDAGRGFERGSAATTLVA
jgi:hypothetical protein